MATQIGPAGRRRVLGTTAAVAVALALALAGGVGAAAAAPGPGGATAPPGPAPTGAPVDTEAVAAQRAVAASTGVTVTGSGFGHGVGLTQYGAYGMARAGFDATQILTHFYTGTQVVPLTDAVDVRVDVVHAATGVVLGSTARAAGGGGLLLAADGAPAAPLEAGATALVTPASGRLALTLRHADGTVTGPEAVGDLEVRWPGTRAVPGAATTVDVTSTAGGARKVRSYRWGSLHLAPVGTRVEAVAVVDVHAEYLRGLAEMPSSWPEAALQAQVVAARNNVLLAARSVPRASCGGCQLWDDTRSQVYTGWG